MKRKRLDRGLWTDIQEKRYVQGELDHLLFHGIASMVYIDKVSRPSIWQYPDTAVTVCDIGMKWFQLLPNEGSYLLTAMMNPLGGINLWYIDIVAGYGKDSDGVIYYDDLYLDLLVRPDGDIQVDDMDELEQALKEKDITPELFDLAIAATERVKGSLLKDIPTLYQNCVSLCGEFEKEAKHKGKEWLQLWQKTSGKPYIRPPGGC